jgi:hypothetical protein
MRTCGCACQQRHPTLRDTSGRYGPPGAGPARPECSPPTNYTKLILKGHRSGDSASGRMGQRCAQSQCAWRRGESHAYVAAEGSSRGADVAAVRPRVHSVPAQMWQRHTHPLCGFESFASTRPLSSTSIRETFTCGRSDWLAHGRNTLTAERVSAIVDRLGFCSAVPCAAHGVACGALNGEYAWRGCSGVPARWLPPRQQARTTPSATSGSACPRSGM